MPAKLQITIWRTEKRPLSGQGLLLPLAFSHFVVLSIMWVFGDALSPAGSLFAVSLASLAGVISIYFLYLRKALGTSTIYVVLGAFLLRLGVGIIHYLLIMQPDYFGAPASFTYLWDYEWMHQSMITVSNAWHLWGFLSPLPADYLLYTKNAYLLAYNAVLYFFSGVNALNVAPWNTLHSIYSAGIVAALGLRAGLSKKQATLALAIAAFQPFGLISSIFWRESVGQFFLALAIYLLVVTQGRLWLWIPLLPMSGLLGFCMREVYLLAVIAVAGFIYFNRLRVSRLRVIIIIIAILVLSLAFEYGLVSLFKRSVLHRYVEDPRYSDLHTRLLTVPLRTVKAMVGPFPWYQVFFSRTLNIEYMPADFLQHVLNISIYILTFPVAMKKWKEFRQIDASMFFGSILLFIGIIAFGMHSPYVSIGSIFFLPVACQTDRRQWLRTLLIVFELFLAANVLYWMLGLTGSGILGIL